VRGAAPVQPRARSGSCAPHAPDPDGARQVTGTVAARFGLLAATMVTSVLIARSLQPAGRGTYHLIMTIAGTTMALGHLSVEQAQTALWPEPEHRPAVAANSLPLGIMVGALAALTALAATSLSGTLLPSSPPGLVPLALAAVPAGIATLYLTNIAILNARVRTANRAALAGAAVQCVGLAALALGEHITVTSAIVVWAVSLATPCWILCGRLAARPGRLDLPVARRTLATGLAYHPGPACTYLLLRADVFLLAAQVPARLVGIYALAVGTAETARYGADSLAQVVLSRQAQRDGAQAAQVTARTTRIAVLIGIGSVLGLAAAAPLALPIVYGRAFTQAVPLLLLLLPGVLVLSVARPASVYLLRSRRARYVVGPSAAGLAVNIGANLALIPRLGPAGCCIASSAGYAVMAALQLWLFTRVTGSRLRMLVPGGADIGVFASAIRAVLGRRALSG
jgi:O-antigen/teichoic acid export membrane protein